MENFEIPVPGTVLAATACGPSDGAPMLALHGWSDNAASFEGLAPLLSHNRVIALDLPGHGWSAARPLGQAYHFIDWVPLVFDAADALGWKQFGLLGHSMGAGIACLAAGVFPERISHLILLDGLGPVVGSEEEMPERLARYVSGRIARARDRTLPNQEAAVARLRAALPYLSEQAATSLARRGTRPVENGVTWRSDPRLHEISPWRLTETQVRSFLKRISAPTLVVRAVDSFPVDERVIEGRLQCIAQCTLQLIAGHHHVHLEAPSRVASVIQDWLRTLDIRTPS